MARPKTTSGYPQIFFDIITQVSGSDKPLVMALENNNAAMAQRFRFYDFLRACRGSSDTRDLETGHMGHGLVFSIKDQFLTIQVRDHTVEAHALEDSLKDWGGTLSSTARGDSSNDKPGELEVPSFTPRISPGTQELPDHDQVIKDYLKEEE